MNVPVAGLPLGLKVSGPWALPKRWACVIDVKKKKKKSVPVGVKTNFREFK